jgi:hypothetical protein
MSFFDELPAEPEPEPPRRHHPWEMPQAEFPGVAAIEALPLGRTGQVAVAITGISAFSAGFELFVTARFRPGADAASDRRADAPRDLGAARRSFRFGMQLSDGSKVIGQHGVVGQHGRGPADDTEPSGPLLRAFLGGGGPHSYFSRWWAWPLPPAGPVEFVSEWPAFGIPETRASIDAQLILDAAGRSVRLWPDEG